MKTQVVRLPVLGGHMVNAFLLIGRRPILVDCGTPGTADRICDGITAAGVDPTDLEMIIITHGHIDHFGAAAELHRRTGAPVAAHEADIPSYSAGQSDSRQRQPIGIVGRLFSRTPPPNARTEPVPIHLVLNDEYRLEDRGIDGRIVPTPGHTAGSVSVLLDQGDVIAGDLISGGFIGALRNRPSQPPFHDDPARALASVRAVMKTEPHTLHIGHGGPMPAERINRWLTSKNALRGIPRSQRGRSATSSTGSARTSL